MISPRIPAAALKYLKRKSSGGAANEKGNKYENAFAVYKIAGLFGLHRIIPQTGTVSGQCDGFVDDLLTDNGGIRFYYQLKSTSSDIKWGVGMKSLFMDFLFQCWEEKYSKRAFKLFLVVTNELNRDRLNRSKPYGIKGCSEAIHFPFHESIAKQVSNDADFRAVLANLSYPGASDDKLESLANYIYGKWAGSAKQAESIKDMYESIEKLNLAFFASPHASLLSRLTMAVLDSISDFSYTMHGGYVTWSHKNSDSGVIPFKIGSPEMNAVEAKIQSVKPQNFNDLEPILS